MINRHYDFCVAAGQPSGRDATGGGKQWADSALYTCRLDSDGSSISIVSSAELPSSPPGYQALARTRAGKSVLYATSGEEVWSLSVSDENELAALGSAPTASGGASHLCTDPEARLLFTANYGSGSVSLLPIAEDGALGEAKVYAHGPGAHAGAEGTWGDGPQFRQESAHPHGVVVCSGQLYVADLGTNQVVCWTIDYDNNELQATSAITLHDLAGPRHIQFTSDGEVGFALNELDNTISVLRRDAAREGELSLVQTLSSLPEGWAEANTDPATFPNEVYSKPSHASELLLSPDDRFVYASNRGHDSIAVFSLDPSSQHLTPVQFEPTRGRIPWVFCLSADGRFVVVQNNHTRASEAGPDSVVVFQRDESTGLLNLAPARLEFPTVSSVWALPVRATHG
ncbi:MAG: lactonase family protein [Gemmatimonadetes bacterium]|jgi:6-phosphogluconolactonase|nr:lactonase family protein [Gemmatimonadota bacterium]MBT5058192.1 lactonase family protein [Gemmatimonadota bacterium]MBT5142731.1 lactonase family protein [Gemmatimonadota bacterium]MBT5587707.1 lactonase family protein [Gemmatimonadota bacterium]MBT5960629.1 lactonase family protein [Gemmatimonadota bacterium]